MTLGVWRRAPITSLNDNGDKMYEGQVWKDGKPHGTGASYWRLAKYYTMGSGKMARNMVKVLYTMRKALEDTKDSGNMANITALALNMMRMAKRCTKESGKMAEDTALALNMITTMAKKCNVSILYLHKYTLRYQQNHHYHHQINVQRRRSCEAHGRSCRVRSCS